MYVQLKCNYLLWAVEDNYLDAIKLLTHHGLTLKDVQIEDNYALKKAGKIYVINYLLSFYDEEFRTQWKISNKLN